MARTKHSVARRARHKKWIKRAKGYRGSRRRVFKRAKEAVLKAGQHSYHHRRKKKSAKRADWQVQIGAASRQQGLPYSRFIQGLRQSNIILDRKVLAQLAVKHPKIFAKIVATVNKEK